jgi:glycosyltransferase involved in cell wall biosynthesis
MVEQAVQADKVDKRANAFRFVSVVLIVYNHAQYVQESLDSVISTRHANLEIIVIDDASQDASDLIILEWIRQHPAHKITYIKHDQNQGLTKSLNEGIDLAQGELIYFNSGDDVVLSDGVTKLLTYLSNNPDKLAVFGDCHVIDHEGKLIHESGIEGLHRRSGMRKSMLEIDSLLRFSIFFHWGVCGPAFMMRKETCAVIGPYDEQLAVDDWDMYLRLAAVGKLGFCNDYIGRYRVHAQNSIFTNAAVQIGDAVRVGRRHAHRFRGITFLRIAGLNALLKHREAKSLPRSFFYFWKSGALLFVSNYLHRGIRLVLFFRHKYFRRE